MGKKEIIPAGGITLKKLKVVIDTNVFISSVLFRGKLEVLVKNWKNGTFEYLLSKEVLNEYIRVLHYSKFEINSVEIKEIVDEELLPYITPVVIHTNIKVVKKDPADDKFFALAIAGKADVIVSGDIHVLSIKKYKAIAVLSPLDFIKMLRAG
ncbi:MAG: putative toxin-antitoxin system toxin component, PIN family [Candidatus Firestonebacteria bacterium RIFOXYC2_FULL_39_67]|nr:MAG: putative toxin-antitoxin system toxin component, PIN family [Candidatus Firestonebacteria bacterium RIFOXYD2_FULL_39_29]OGF54993.1 MAG: putative toxin-antitoxin system toxin component, PIN family [Candidatus Firestonebacteria bacterium RIFOXYC2_FULL_39_67]OGF57018.1 MAG: putative toxin-antitoxin system toxin component, PIN family [Candidatus Firestonebacteria bacterium RifOxyC12_full_39_7]